MKNGTLKKYLASAPTSTLRTVTPAPALVDERGYPGSKAQAGVFQRIIGQMPPHSLYVEAFFGSGQIFHRKRPAAASVVIDVDAGVIAKARAACPGATVIHGDAHEALP